MAEALAVSRWARPAAAAVGAGTVALALVVVPWFVRRMIGPLPASRPLPPVEALWIGSFAVGAGLLAAAVTLRSLRGGRR